jgi:hypothetical protein
MKNAPAPMLPALLGHARNRGWALESLRRFRMEDDPTKTDPTKTDPDPTKTDPAKGADGKTDEDRGYPLATPVSDMSAAQQAAYWKAQSRKHEERAKERGDYDDVKTKADQYDALLKSTQTDQERAVETAKKEAEEQARADERAKNLPRLVDAEIRIAAAGRIDAERLKAAIEPLDRSKFLTDKGEIDEEKVTSFVATLAPSSDEGKGGKTFPNLGQGRRTEAAKASVSRGAELYREQHPKKS